MKNSQQRAWKTYTEPFRFQNAVQSIFPKHPGNSWRRPCAKPDSPYALFSAVIISTQNSDNPAYGVQFHQVKLTPWLC